MSEPMSRPYSYAAPRRRKLSQEQVAEIVRRYNDGERVADLATAFGVTSAAISYRVGKHTILWRDRYGQSAAQRRRECAP